MKLKLDTQTDLVILSVTEDFLPEHAPILKAGLNKIARAGKTSIVLDLMNINPPTHPEFLKELRVMSFGELTSQVKFFIASPLEEVGHATSREGACTLFNDKLTVLLALEARLKPEYDRLEKEKSELERKLEAAEKDGDDMKSLLKESSNLKMLIQLLEDHLKELLKTRHEPLPTTPSSEKLETAMKILHTILEQEGIIPLS